MYLVTIFSAFAMLWLHFNFQPFFFHLYYFTCAPFSVIIFLSALLLVATELQVIYINTLHSLGLSLLFTRFYEILKPGLSSEKYFKMWCNSSIVIDHIIFVQKMSLTMFKIKYMNCSASFLSVAQLSSNLSSLVFILLLTWTE